MKKAKILIPDPNEMNLGELPTLNAWDSELITWKANLEKAGFHVELAWGKGYDNALVCDGKTIATNLEIALFNLEHGFITNLYVCKHKRGQAYAWDGNPVLPIATNNSIDGNSNIFHLTKGNTEMNVPGSTFIDYDNPNYKNIMDKFKRM